MAVKIVRVIARLNVGGPAIHTILLTSELQGKEFESVLVTGVEGPDEGNMHALAESKGVTFTVVPTIGREVSLWKDLCSVWRLYRILRREKPRIVHTHTAKAGTVGRLAAVLARVPIRVHTFHGHVLHSYFSPAKTKVFVWIERFLARFSNAIITLSEQQRREILGFGIGRPEQFHVIGLGLELEPFLDCQSLRGQLRSELRLDWDTPLLGIVARLVPIKAHVLLFEAFERLVRKRPDCHLAVVGDGELREELKADVARRKLEDRVHFLGFRSELPEVYADLDVVVLCSLNEGLPVTLIEAMAAGRPLVATNVGGVKDLVEDGVSGMVVPPRDAGALADALDRLLSDRATAEVMGLQGREAVYPKYGAQTLVENMRRLYRELMQDL